MSLKTFHRVFILVSIAALAFVASWASGRNAAGLKTPWALAVSLTGIALLTPYLAWRLKSR